MSIEFQERPIDRYAATFLCRGSDGGAQEVEKLVVSLVSQTVGKGNICLDLKLLSGKTLRVSPDREVSVPPLDQLSRLLYALPAVGRPGEHTPLVLDHVGRLYLYRYWRYEQELARIILCKAGALGIPVDQSRMKECLQRLFPSGIEDEMTSQQQAASRALCSLFSVITGGPGTGKTSTVVRVLALILEQPGGMRHRIALAAPTGKAAARLNASITAIRERLSCADEIKSAIPTEVVTVHRLLGSRHGSVRFRHSAANPLPYDTIIVDEASMVDLPLMAALVTALLPTARFILLGDREQLASVEAGAVLGDICTAGEAPSSLLGKNVVFLDRNYRFQAGSGIGALAKAVNEGRGRDAVELLRNAMPGGVAWMDVKEPGVLNRLLEERVMSGYRAVIEAASPSEALQRFERFRILCAFRDGPALSGVNSVNRAVENILAKEGLITPNTIWYKGRPLLITANDYPMQLFNGDTGLLFPDPDRGGALRAFFPNSGGGVRSIAPERLAGHETAFAMTVHKSQGSEFDRVLLILPSTDSELLTRELLYTAITRAKESVEIWGDEAVFSAAAGRKSERHSGLMDLLLQSSQVS